MTSPRLGAANVLMGTAVRLVVAAVGTLAIAAIIGPAYKGVLATLMSLSTIAAVVLSWGVSGAISYYIATKRWTDAQFNTLCIVWTVVATAVAYVAFEVIYQVGGNQLLGGLSGAEFAAATGSVVLYSLAGHALLSLRQFRIYAVFEVTSAASNPVVFFALLVLGSGKLGAAVWGWIVSQAVVGVSALVVMLRRSKWRLAIPSDAKGVAWFALRAGGWDVLQLFNLRLDVLLMRYFSTAAATGAYALATQLTEVVWLVPVSIGLAVFPEVADGGHEEGAWTARVARLTSAVSIVLAVAVGLAGTVLVGIFMKQYAIAIPAIWLLLPGTAVAATSKVLGNDLNARGLPHTLLWAAAASLIVTVVGDFALIPVLGSVGAAVVSSLAYTVSAMVLVAYFTRVTGSTLADLVPRWSDLAEAWRVGVETGREFFGRVPGLNRG